MGKKQQKSSGKARRSLSSITDEEIEAPTLQTQASTSSFTDNGLTDEEQRKYFYKDLPKIVLLVILYGFQGLPIGFFLSTVPVLFKKYLSYSEIGVIMMCTMPFSFKVLWSPFVEFYHIESVGKRRTWIIPTQLFMCAILVYLQIHLEELLIAKEVYTVSAMLIFLVFVITCQDIAVDAWAIEMLFPCNAAYGSSSQSIGQRLGIFISTSVFISLNSVEFCNRWLRNDSTATEDPILTMSSFIMIWIIVQFVITIYIAIFVPEKDKELEQFIKDNQIDEDQEEEEFNMSQVFSIFKNIVQNKNLQLWFGFSIFMKATWSIQNNVSEVYMTNDLGFPIESLSMIKVICTPFNIAFAFLSSYLSSKEPFKFQFYNLLIMAILCSYSVLFMLGTFPEKDQISYWTNMHVTVIAFFLDLLSNIEFVTNFSIIMQIADKRISAIHITLLAAMTNFGEFVHKFYVFTLVDYMGIFLPQAILLVISLLVAVTVRKQFIALQDLPIKSWHVQDGVLNISKKVE